MRSGVTLFSVIVNKWKVNLMLGLSNKRTLFCANNLCRNMSCEHPIKDKSALLPPKEVRGMKKLDKEKFSKYVVVPWLELDDQHVGGAMHVLKKYLLKLPNLKPLRPAYELLEGEEVLTFNESTLAGLTKRVLLNPVLIGSVTDFDQQDNQKLKDLGISVDLKFSKIIIGYDNWRADEILQAILPEDSALTSYSLIGHIVHVNLREPLVPFKEVIGSVLLDKVNGAKTVVNKTDIIDSTFRNFKMEVLCGIDNMVTRTREHGCIFELDFSAVYWNPRLATEHERITSKLKSGDVLYDVFAGVGPFSIPAGKRKCNVLANDLNPESYKWLNVSCRLNKVQQFVRTFNKDGKLFIEEDVKNDMIQRLKHNKLGKTSVHITMNLPASAVKFLSTFCGLLRGVPEITRYKNCPIVHVYCFVSDENPDMAARALVEENLGCQLGENLEEVSFVRNVAPNKDMMRVSFKLSHKVLMTNCDVSLISTVEEKDLAPSAKRICLSNDVK